MAATWQLASPAPRPTQITRHGPSPAPWPTQWHGSHLASRVLESHQHRGGMEARMETALLGALVGLSTLIVCALLFRFRRVGLPPSPFSLPIIGHLHLLGKNPHESLRNLARKHGGVMFLRLGAINTLVVCSPDAARDVLKTHDVIFASRPVDSGGQFFGYNAISLTYAPYGEHWRNLRKLCSLELFSPSRVEMFMPVRKLEVSLLLNELLESRDVVMLFDKLTDLTFNIMLRTVVNKSYSEGGGSSKTEREETLRFKDLIIQAFSLASGMGIGEFLPYLKWMDNKIPKIKAIQDELDKFLQREVDEHRKRWKQGQAPVDFTDVMLSIATDGGLDDTLIKAMILDILAAGTDSNAISVEWGLAELLKNPGALRQAQAELDAVIGPNRTMQESDIPKLKYLQAVVKESFRLHPPVPIINHESSVDCKVGGYVIPAKTRAIVNVHAIGRDASTWEAPDTFDPHRFLAAGRETIDVQGKHFELIPFGSGRRSCPAMQMGLLTVQLALGSLVHAFDWHMPDGSTAENLDMTGDCGATLPKAFPLKLVPSPRLPREAIKPCQH